MFLHCARAGAVALSFFALASISPAQAVPAPGPDAFGYGVTEITNNLRNISATGANVGADDDTVSGPLSFGFDFNLYGNTYSSAYVSSNGFCPSPLLLIAAVAQDPLCRPAIRVDLPIW